MAKSIRIDAAAREVTLLGGMSRAEANALQQRAGLKTFGPEWTFRTESGRKVPGESAVRRPEPAVVPAKTTTEEAVPMRISKRRLAKMGTAELEQRRADGRREVQLLAAGVPEPGERPARLKQMQRAVADVEAVQAELTRRSDQAARVIVAERRRSGNLTPEEREAAEQQAKFEADVAAARRQEAQRDLERREAAGLTLREPLWEGARVAAAAILASPLFWGYRRGILPPGESFVQESVGRREGRVWTPDDLAKLYASGRRLAPLYTRDDADMLICALHLYADRADTDGVARFAFAERGLWPEDVAKVDAHNVSLRKFHGDGILELGTTPDGFATLRLGARGRAIVNEFLAEFGKPKSGPRANRQRRPVKPQPVETVRVPLSELAEA